VSRPRALLSWSSGKDSAWTLHELRRRDEVEVAGLLTTVTETFDRVAMHGVRHAQAAAAGLPLWPVRLPWPCPNETYEARMAEAVAQARAEGITHIAFGDLHLADVRAYRERQLAGTGIEPLFPIWGEPTDDLARRMIDAGFTARITCLDPGRLPRAFAGRSYDAALLDELPADIDPCGEYGEFHTFCHAGPIFEEAIEVTVGETVERDGFVFTDLQPAR